MVGLAENGPFLYVGGKSSVRPALDGMQWLDSAVMRRTRVYASYSSRVIPSFCILDCRVVRFIPSRTAAPRTPAMTPPDSRRVRKMYSRSTSSNVEPDFLVRSGDEIRNSAMGAKKTL